MKFYTCHLEYDEIYYDTRVRMETVCREENENTWGNRYPGCYIAISKITTALMTIVVAVADNSIKESTIVCYIQKIIEEVAPKVQNNKILEELEKLRLKEVTLNTFLTVINDNALNRLFSDKATFLEKIRLSENDKCFKEYFEKAKGSVLFIDEAYALVDEQNSFGDEAINTIVQEMENHREDVVVIMAGYKAEMEKLLNKNQGLRSRVSFYIEFPDYTVEELYCIMQKLATREGFTLESDVREAFSRNIMNVNIQNGNGRFARNLLERAKIRQAGRVLKLPLKEQKSEMMIIRGKDFED